jgi:hypothetical protein
MHILFQVLKQLLLLFLQFEGENSLNRKKY